MLHRFPARIWAPLAPLTLLTALGGCAQTMGPPAPATPAGFVGEVSSADPRAQDAGMAMLRQGGNATDAVIATMLALTVVEPQSSGIGGGGFYVRGTRDGAITSLDGRETAPSGAFPEWFLDAQGKVPPFEESQASGLSVGVPGNLALAWKAHERYGKLPWAALFQPAIALARDGFVVNRQLFNALSAPGALAKTTATGRAWLYGADGKPQPVGARVTNPALAETFTAIANDGPPALYSGARAQAIASHRRSGDSAPQADDCRGYRRLYVQGTRAGVRQLSRLSHLRDGAPEFRRDRGGRHARHARAVRPEGARAAEPGDLAPVPRSPAARLCRP